MMTAGALTALTAWQHWGVCRPATGSEACLSLRKASSGSVWWLGGDTRNASALILAAVAATVIAGAWLVVIRWAQGSAVRLVMAAIIAGQPLLVAGLTEAELISAGRPLGLGIDGWLTWPAEILVFPLLLGAGWLLDQTPAHTLRLLLLGWGVTSFGPMHHFVDDVATTMLLRGGPGVPAGLGYVTAGTQISIGLALVVISLAFGRPTATGDDDDRYGPDGFTLAA